MATVIKSVSIGVEMWQLAEKHHISASEAIKVGISTMLAEKGEDRFQNNLNYQRKIEKMSSVIAEMAKKLEGFEKNVV